jgi:nitrogen fixation NifU-like protein
MHHPRLLDHFRNPRNAGELERADAVVEVSNPVCGDILRLSIRLKAGRVAAAGLKCRGCVASMACGSALTELLVGRDVAGMRALSAADVERAVGPLPATGKHAAALAVEACRAAASGLKTG